MQETPSTRFVFPRWANFLLPIVLLGVVGGAFYVTVAVGYGASPKTMAVGYQPVQPVPYSHALHAGKLGMDCRYCHNTVEKTAFAALPATQTCMNCHSAIKNLSLDAPKKENNASFEKDNADYQAKVALDPLAPIRDSYNNNTPVKWVKIHNLAGYAYFNHSAHVTHGVGCVECHGRIDHMEVVSQVAPLSMGWCLDCHRNPGPHLRPRDVSVTDMNWTRTSSTPSPDELVKAYGIRDVTYMQSCYTCHR